MALRLLFFIAGCWSLPHLYILLPLPPTTLVDLTHDMSASSITWPSNQPFVVTQEFRGLVEAGYWYEGRSFAQAEHSGTHLDAPAHFHQGSWRVSEIPITRLVGPGVLVDITKKVEESGLDSELTVNDLTTWEEEHGAIPRDSVVIVHTGHGRLYGNRTAYLGYPPGIQVTDDDTENLHFPGVGEKAARWLVEERAIVGLGIDTPSTDRGQSREFLTHRVLGAANVWGVENLARTASLPPRGFQVFAMVHRLQGGSGGPARVLAVVEDRLRAYRVVSSGSILTSSILALLLAFLI